MSGIAWIAVDWGTSNLRAWAMGPDDVPLAEAGSDEGMGRLEAAAYEPALLALIGPWLGSEPIDVVACGMVGSRQGWVEAPYAAVPGPPRPTTAPTRAPVRDPRLRVHVLPGLKQADPPDVMRGEETQIAGFLAGEPEFDGVACLPGTHSKWAHLSAGEVVSFRSFLTGELFALLSRQSVLRHSVASEGWSDSDFAEAVGETLSRPETLAARLFGLRAAGLIAGLEPVRARARLSGILIGAELAATRPYWLGRAVVLIGADRVSAAYAAALSLVGVTARRVPAEAMTLAGLAAAHATLPARTAAA
jgi:2-dehydro-3-deoxygalactonokinase